MLGPAIVGTAFANEIGFTITDGSTAFAEGYSFTMTENGQTQALAALAAAAGIIAR